MKASFERRISIARCWAASRIALLDTAERYEDSYCISQEFCEWITGINFDSEELQTTIMNVPNFIKKEEEGIFDTDELLER